MTHGKPSTPSTPSMPRSRRRAATATPPAAPARSEPPASSEPIAAEPPAEPTAEPTAGPKRGGPRARSPRSTPHNTSPRPRKLDQLVAMLAGQLGASLSQLCELTGWQPHSVRAALSGLRKQGYRIEGSKEGSTVTLYRITGRVEGGPDGGTKSGPGRAATDQNSLAADPDESAVDQGQMPGGATEPPPKAVADVTRSAKVGASSAPERADATPAPVPGEDA